MRKRLSSILLSLLVLAVHIEAKEEREAPAMKCGAGKCGANMFDGNAALGKKKKNILSQMRDDDPRKDCVIDAATTKAVYDCVRDPNGKKLTTRCGMPSDDADQPSMKCGAGKCGDTAKRIILKKEKEVNDMKCGAGRCGSSM